VTQFPNPDRAAARELGAALRRLDYNDDGITELLGDDAFDVGPKEAPVHLRRLPDTKLAVAIRLFFLQIAVSRADATRAFGDRVVDAIARTALAEVGSEIVPHSRITTIGDVLLASDGFSRDNEDPADYVATYTPTSRLLDVLTPRPHVRRALDVGTGPGIHALLAAAHSDHVIATDVNERALAYTALNAALNDYSNVEVRPGSLFEPVSDERFDLITCNAPFVVSPDRRWTYRDAGYDADELSAIVVREAADHLEEGGYATVLVSWLAHHADEPDERALEWVEDIGCDAWILPMYEADPLDHAAGWNDHLAVDRAAYEEALDSWTGYLEDLGVEHVTEGAIVLHKRDAAEHDVRIDEVEEDELDDAGEQVVRAFANRARLARLPRKELLDAKLEPAMPLSVELSVPSQREVAVHLDEGTHSDLEAPRAAVEVLEKLDGSTPLRDAVDNGYERQTLELVRELLALGALRFS
jgi:methylase of polypeptide subunit release factors